MNTLQRVAVLIILGFVAGRAIAATPTEGCDAVRAHIESEIQKVVECHKDPESLDCSSATESNLQVEMESYGYYCGPVHD